MELTIAIACIISMAIGYVIHSVIKLITTDLIGNLWVDHNTKEIYLELTPDELEYIAYHNYIKLKVSHIKSRK